MFSEAVLNWADVSHELSGDPRLPKVCRRLVGGLGLLFDGVHDILRGEWPYGAARKEHKLERARELIRSEGDVIIPAGLRFEIRFLDEPMLAPISNAA